MRTRFYILMRLLLYPRRTPAEIRNTHTYIYLHTYNEHVKFT